MTISSIKRLYTFIDCSLSADGDYERITDAIISLAHAVHGTDDDDIWYIGEMGSFTLGDLIEGAYWHYTDWHKGQWSKEYAALSALGQIFSPGLPTLEFDNIAYEMLEEIAEEI